MNKLKDSRAAFCHWLVLLIAICTAASWYVSGTTGAWAFLVALWGGFIAWASMTIGIFALIVLAAVIGSPFRWFKND